MKRIKAFSYLKRTIPVLQFDIVSHIVFVVAMLSNYQCPLRDSSSATFEKDGPDHSMPDAPLSSSDDEESEVNTVHNVFNNSPVRCDLTASPIPITPSPTPRTTRKRKLAT